MDGDFVGDGGAADGDFVLAGGVVAGGVDDEVDLAVFDHVENVGAAAVG